MKQVLTIDEMNTLIGFGIDASTASMCYVPVQQPGINETKTWVLMAEPPSQDYHIPAYTLTDLLEKIPQCIDYVYTDEYNKGDVENSQLQILPGIKSKWELRYFAHIHEYGAPSFEGDELIDLVYQQMLWLIKHGYMCHWIPTTDSVDTPEILVKNRYCDFEKN